jgi:hypothetical protein
MGFLAIDCFLRVVKLATEEPTDLVCRDIEAIIEVLPY